MVNRSYVLDLTPKRSLVRYLQWPGHLRLHSRLGRARRRSRARGTILRRFRRGKPPRACFRRGGRRRRGGAVTIAGYCMGGLCWPLALALARGGQCQWRRLSSRPLGIFMPSVENKRGRPRGRWPPWMPHSMTLAGRPAGRRDPDIVCEPRPVAGLSQVHPFRRPRSGEIGGGSTISSRSEDWLNDGVALPHKVARECLVRIGMARTTPVGVATGRSTAKPIRPEGLERTGTVDCAVDRTASYHRTRPGPWRRVLPEVRNLTARAGHIGMMTGSKRRGGMLETRWQSGLRRATSLESRHVYCRHADACRAARQCTYIKAHSRQSSSRARSHPTCVPIRIPAQGA